MSGLQAGPVCFGLRYSRNPREYSSKKIRENNIFVKKTTPNVELLHFL